MCTNASELPSVVGGAMLRCAMLQLFNVEKLLGIVCSGKGVTQISFIASHVGRKIYLLSVWLLLQLAIFQAKAYSVYALW